MNKLLHSLFNYKFICLLLSFFLSPNIGYSATKLLYVGETGRLETPDAVSSNGYIDHAAALASDTHLYIDTSDPLDVKVTVLDYFDYTATVTIRFVERYTYNGHPDKVDHDVNYTISAKYPVITMLNGEKTSVVNVSVGGTANLEYKVEPAGLLAPPMHCGFIPFDMTYHIEMIEEGYNQETGMGYLKVKGKSEGKNMIIALPYGNQKLNIIWEVNVGQSEKIILKANPSGGEVTAGTKVYLSTTNVSGCDIYYTLNGNPPSKSSTPYTSSGITITSACTLKAIAYKSGYEDSDVLTATYTIKEDTKPKLVLSASPSGGQVSAGTTVTLTAKANGSTVSGCDIYYTTNGTTPSRSNGTKYSSGITINSACTLKAIAYKDGYEDSDALTATYTIQNTQKVNPTSISFRKSSLSMKTSDTFELWFSYDYPEGTPYSL